MEDKPENETSSTPETGQDNTPQPSAPPKQEGPTSQARPETPVNKPESSVAANDSGKLLGIPKESFVKLCYVLTLVASGYGVLSHLVGLVGVYIPLGQLFGLIGFIGVILAIVGWAAFSEKLKPVDNSHLKFLVILFLGLFIFYLIFANSFGWFGFFGQLFGLIIASVQFGALYVGLKLWKEGRDATKDNLLSEFNVLKNKAQAKIKKADDGIE
jgi:hypothetical protein